MSPASPCSQAMKPSNPTGRCCCPPPSSTSCGAETRHRNSPMTGRHRTGTCTFRRSAGSGSACSRIPPETGSAEQELFNAEEAVADIEGKLPGLLRYMDPSDPGMHATDTIDFEVVLEGTVVLELDDGAEVTLHRRRHRGSERDATSVEEPWRFTRPDGAVHLRRQPFGRASGVTASRRARQATPELGGSTPGTAMHPE